MIWYYRRKMTESYIILTKQTIGKINVLTMQFDQLRKFEIEKRLS